MVPNHSIAGSTPAAPASFSLRSNSRARGNAFTHRVTAIVVDAIDTMHRALTDGSTVTALLAAALVDRGFELLEGGLEQRTGEGHQRRRAGAVALAEAAGGQSPPPSQSAPTMPAQTRNSAAMTANAASGDRRSMTAPSSRGARKPPSEPALKTNPKLRPVASAGA